MWKTWIRIFIFSFLSGLCTNHVAIAFTDKQKRSDNRFSGAWLTCSVTSQVPGDWTRWADKICTATTEALSATPITYGKFQEILSGRGDTMVCQEAWLARLRIDIINRHLLRFDFSHGSTEEWRQSKQTSYDNFDLNVRDSDIDLRILEHFVRTLKALAS